ncbi:MAG: hypothetical protein HETSPECPRED_005260 [Heterodermia speciosa]|uniref:Effector protein n=1 Tax=Heterodermia speciosa TaxID=116794 RepID=A0A8H3ILB4_9LECA|nr:MAG: hypothetical protein HETSPECPRED_005260 [Heterodermia speciosa]
MHKHIVYCLGILQLALISIVRATPTSQLNQRNGSLESASTLSTLPDLPKDNEVMTAANYYPYHLQDTPVFMAAIRALHDLASRDFEEDSIPGTSWSHPLFPEVKLTVRPAPGKRLLSVRFAMWIILFSTRCLIEENKYSGEFLNLYRNEPIGYMVVLPTARIARQGNSSTQGTQPNGANPFPNYSSPQYLSSGTAANDDPQATVFYVGKNIDRADFFLALLWIILDLAPHSGEPMIVWRLTRATAKSEISTIWNRVKPPAGSPQYDINKGYLLSMFAQLPEICLRDKKLQEMNIEITENGQLIARGLIRSKPLPGLPSGPLIMNDTVV